MPVLPGTPPVEITLCRSARARRFSLRVSRLDGRVTLSLPVRAREADALAFAAVQEGWIRSALAGIVPGAEVGFGTILPVAGRALTIGQGTGRMRVEGDLLLVAGDPGPKVRVWLKALARARLAEASDRYAAQIGRRYARLTLRDTRSRWGSCTADGGLMYNWRLILAPPEVLDYVAAHEVAHLAEMNHSPAFWAVVAGLMPDYAPRRAWLRREGQALHAWRFEWSPREVTTAAHERLYRSLRTQVMHGELAPGQALTLRGLGREFGVSMTPAREAVRRLVAEGALSLSSSGRVATPELTPERIEELAAIRALLEPELASRALPRAHFALIDRLAAINMANGEAVAKGDAVGYIRTNLEFHRTLYLRAQAPAMLALTETVWLQLGPTMRALYGRLRRNEPPAHHRHILAALRAGDEPGLRLAIRTDVTQGLRHLAGWERT